MTKINRRNWLRKASLTGATGLALPSLLANYSSEEIQSFNARPLADLIKLSSNENPYGPSEKVRKAMTDAFNISCRYPFSYSQDLFKMIAEKEGVPENHIVIGGGSTEGLKLVGLTYGKDGGEIIAARPTFLAMMTYARQWGGTVNWVPVNNDLMHDLPEMEKRISSKTKLIFLCNPNNPTSTLLPRKEVMDFCETASQKAIVFSDEAYYDFIEEEDYPSMVELVKKGQDVIVSRTFSKVYGLAGLRIGYMVAKPSIAAELRKNVMAFTNVLAIQAAKTAMEEQSFYDFSLAQTKAAKKSMMATLDELNLEYAPSHTNFLFFKSGRNIDKLNAQMREQGVMIGRPFPPFTDWCRISTGTLEEVEVFNQALKKVIA